VEYGDEQEIRHLEAEVYNLEVLGGRLESDIRRLEEEKYELMDRLDEPCQGCGT